MKKFFLIFFSICFIEPSSQASELCKEYFKTPSRMTVVQMPSAPKDTVAGMPQDRPYLILSDSHQLRYYQVNIVGDFASLANRRILKFEEKVFLGLYSEDTIASWGSNFSKLRYEMKPTQDGKIYEIYEWVPRIDIPIDSKTGLIDANEDTGKELLKTLVQQSAGSKTTRDGIIFVDINNLKMINSTRRAHVAGDEYIERAIAIVKSHLRISGHRENSDIGFKVGGDEFVFIIRNVDTARLEEISQRFEGSVSQDRQLRDLFSEPVREFQDVAAKLWSLSSYKDLTRFKELHAYIIGTKTWAALSLKQKRNIENDSAVFRDFINRYLRSIEVEVLMRQYDAIRPGIAVGRSLIQKNSSYVQLYGDADRDMTRRKMEQKRLDFAELPLDVVITPDIFTLPSIR